MRNEMQNSSANILSIVDRVRPSVEELLKTHNDDDLDSFIQEAVKANVLASVNLLRTGSPMLKALVDNDGLLVVGAEYSLETGKVEFYEDD